MNQNDQDSTNQNEQSQPSRILKPAHINQYFDKIQANPKLWQLQTKLKPNPTDKFTKFTYKTHNNSLHSWRWLKNSKLKFQTKQGKTKLSINMKMIDNITQEKKPNKKSNNQLDQMKDAVPYQKINQKSIKKQSNNAGLKGQGQGPYGGDLDVSFSTSYDDTRLNIRIKDRGQLDIKVNQTIDITPSLKAELQYTHQHKKNTGLNKYSTVLFYTTGVGRWINQILASQFIKKGNTQKLPYHKNQTKIKARISDHSDPQINVTSINHFGQIKFIQNQIPIAKQNKQKQNQQNGKKQPQQKQTQIKQNQILKSKLQFDNKLTLLRKQGDGFNFKTLFNFESVTFKQIIKLQTTINDTGFNGIQSKYICKYWPKLVLGCQLGTNYNSHNSQWHKKWQLVLQKQNVDYLGNFAMSISNKHAGVRIIKKIGEYRFEMVGSGKWNAKGVYQPKFGIKINLNL